MSTKPRRDPLPELLAAARSEAEIWLGNHRQELPQAVVDALDLSLRLAKKLTAERESRRSVLAQLRRALGITASSERRKNSDHPLSGSSLGEPGGQPSKKERLGAEIGRSKRLAKRYRRLANRHDKKAHDLEGCLMKVEDIELTPEEEAQIDKEDEEHWARTQLGQRCDLDCAAPKQMLMTGMATHVTSEVVACDVDRDALPRRADIKQRFIEDRERVSFSFTVKRLELEIEKLSVETSSGTTLVTASLDQIGPPKFKVTWEFLASMSIMVAQYAMPMSRFAALASSPVKRFTGGEMSRYFRYVADRLCPVYIELGRSLANSAILSGDDTTSRVIEVNKAWAQLEKDAKCDMPWQNYATREKAEAALKADADAPVAVRLAREFGFESERKDGRGTKKSFNTTVLSGRQDVDDPRTTVIFFRSHLGGLGNLLTEILRHRHPDNLDLTIQSDLSTVNLISDVSLRDRLRIKLAGCASHARRPFAQYEDDDPDLCSWLLNSFQGISIFEGGLDAHGRNRDNTAAVRDVDERAAWEKIKEVCGRVAQKWSRETELGEGARYVLKHFDKLTLYLTDHRLSPTNNFSERMLRLEKLIENSALFRQTLEGRFALDIVRTVLQTAIAAGVELNIYLQWLLRMPSEAIEAEPEAFTPLAFARFQAQIP